MQITPVANPINNEPVQTRQEVKLDTTDKNQIRAKAIAAYMGSEQAQTQESSVKSEASEPKEEQITINSMVSDVESSMQGESAEKVEEPVEEAPEAVQEAKDDSEESQEQTKKEDPEQESLSARFAQLARREKAQRDQALKLKADKDALERERAVLDAIKSERSSEQTIKQRLQSKKPQDVLGVLAELGLSYDQIAEAALANETERSPESRMVEELKREIQEMKDAQSNYLKQQQEAQQKQYENALNQLREEAKQLVESNPDFETVKATDSVEDIVELIQENFNRTGKVLSVEQAAREIEDYLAEEATKLASLKKIQSRLAPPAKSEKAPEKSAGQQQAQAPKAQGQVAKTLTNAAGSSAKLSARERAILAARGELK